MVGFDWILLALCAVVLTAIVFAVLMSNFENSWSGPELTAATLMWPLWAPAALVVVLFIGTRRLFVRLRGHLNGVTE